VALLLAVAVVALLVVLLARPATLAPARRNAPPDLGGTSVAVIIPARDEAESLPTLLESLWVQTRPADQVVVVDDGSVDATADVAAAAGATVVRIKGPPADWTGKTWACHTGVAATTADMLVILDADTWLDADALERLLAHHDRDVASGLLSVQPYHETYRPYEELSAMCNLVAVLASGMAALRAPRSSPIAFGPCLVTSRAALRRAGGFEAVRSDVIEDAALAARYADAGRPVRCLLGGATVRFRMYPDGLRSLVDGWTKNLAGGARRAPLLPALGASSVVALLFALVVEAVRTPSVPTAVAWLIVAAALRSAFGRVGSFRWWTALAFPVPLLMFTWLVVRSAWARTVRRSVVWRGRRVGVR
jgi:4,4'-diaponeurosporenoate glycosyltransferase